MTARAENRYRQNSMAAARKSNQVTAERDSLHLARGNRVPYVQTVTPSVSKRSVRSWMVRNAADYDGPTQLAEAAACEFDFGVDPCADETHWIWDCAADCCED